MIEFIKHQEMVLALLLRGNHISDDVKDGIKFITPDNFSQQIGYMKRDSGHYTSSYS